MGIDYHETRGTAIVPNEPLAGYGRKPSCHSVDALWSYTDFTDRDELEKEDIRFESTAPSRTRKSRGLNKQGGFDSARDCDYKTLRFVEGAAPDMIPIPRSIRRAICRGGDAVAAESACTKRLYRNIERWSLECRRSPQVFRKKPMI